MTSAPSACEDHPMKIMVAMLDCNRGIGYKMRLPWPHISGDFEYYRKMISSLKDKEKVVVHIRGRLTWLATDQEERTLGGKARHVVLTTAEKFPDSDHPNIAKVVPSFQEAVDFINTPPFSRSVETVWVMGGRSVYEEALKDPRLQYIYLTRVFGDFPADVTFPEFEQDFVRISDSDVPEGLQEENGVKYQFELYRRKQPRPSV